MTKTSRAAQNSSTR